MTLRGVTRGAGRGRRYAGRLRAAPVLLLPVLALSVSALSACGGEATPEPPVATWDGTTTPVPTGPGGTAPPVPTHADGSPRKDREHGPREVLVTVNVSGGLAGVNNRLTVRYDGSHTTRSGTGPPRDGRMSPAEVARLRAALEAPAYAKVAARPSGKPVHDGFTYVVTYDYRVVVSTDGDRPEALRRVFSALPDGGPPTSP
ncbi:hypothetical protein AB0D99_09075 [Streptomyces sp. NPDC047971]|uniref:hypothetical protein n=1 Tax=Streptomyces sp. NPDC047971 TaxID=3154499 RepID=UPI0033CCC469